MHLSHRKQRIKKKIMSLQGQEIKSLLELKHKMCDLTPLQLDFLTCYTLHDDDGAFRKLR
jgi:hypothetical protein